MARSDFYRNIAADQAQELDILSRLQFDLRETRKTLLAQYDAEDARALCLRILDGSLPRNASADAVKAAVLEDEQAAVRAELTARLSRTSADSVSLHGRIAALIETRAALAHPDGVQRRFDALELRDAAGAMRILRVAALDWWFLEWGEQDSGAQSLSRLPGDETLWCRTADGRWRQEPLARIPDHDLGALVDALLDWS